MRMLLLIHALFLLSCGSTPPGRVLLRHVVLTNLTSEDAAWAELQRYARNKAAKTIVPFRDLEAQISSIAGRLRSLDPYFVTVIAKTETIDVNMALAMHEIATRVDRDIFTDIHYGFLPAGDGTLLRRYLKTLAIIQHKKDDRLLRHSWIRSGETAGETRDQLRWAGGMYRRTLTYVPGGDNADTIADALADGDFILIQGDGDPKGLLGGIDVRDASRLSLDTVSLWATVPGGATLRRQYVRAPGGRTDVRIYEGVTTFAHAVLHRGAAAWFASFLNDSSACAGGEFEYACYGGEALGASIKRTYDLLALTRPDAPRKFDRVKQGAPFPEEWRRRKNIAAAATRVLIGDPSLIPFSRSDTTPPYREIGSHEDIEDGKRIYKVEYEVSDGHEHSFVDPFTGDPMLHIRFVLPRNASNARAVAVKSGSRLKIASQAMEQWHGESRLHVVLHGPGPQAGNRLHLHVRLN